MEFTRIVIFIARYLYMHALVGLNLLVKQWHVS
uniref:Uncharacterized protein n=1 Tax=Arundo donax TaxID=35708 RepID=A0A0A9BI59_ARUDO